MMKILTLNCWSHAIKYHLFSGDGQAILAAGTIERVALGSSFIKQRVPGREPYYSETDNKDHLSAVALILATLTDPQHGAIASASEISAVGHRVAHGGKDFRHSVQIDDHVLDAIRNLQNLAPLHTVPNLAGIEAAMHHLPDIPHVATFDTAFHSSLPDYAYIYPLPYDWYEKYGVRRYGFHGPSHLYLSRRASVLFGKPVEACNLITIHLDRGVSLCAIKNGLSIDTSMGMTPLEGAVMETRCGDIDPGIHAYMMQELNISTKDMEQILNLKSGIFGMTGHHQERQDFLQAVLVGDPRCKMALEVECYRIKKYIGSYLAITGPLDGIVFTVGAGALEWLVREKVLSGLERLGIDFDRDKNSALRSKLEEVEISSNDSRIKILVIPTNEELVIAEDVAAIHSGISLDHLHHDYSFMRHDFVPFGSQL